MSAIQEEVVVPRLKALVVDDSKLACFVLGRILERQVLRRVEESTHAMARSQLVQRTERTALTLERIERRLAELPAAISTADAAADAYCLRDEGFGSYVLEPARAGVGCTAGAATAATQTVAALAIN